MSKIINGVVYTQFEGGTDEYVMKTIDIGDWDIPSSNTLSVNHGLSSTEWKSIRGIEVIIRNDTDTTYIVGCGIESATLNYTLGVLSYTSTNIGLVVDTSSGLYLGSSFSTTSYNRGWITFWYIPD